MKALLIVGLFSILLLDDSEEYLRENSENIESSISILQNVEKGKIKKNRWPFGAKYKASNATFVCGQDVTIEWLTDGKTKKDLKDKVVVLRFDVDYRKILPIEKCIKAGDPITVTIKKKAFCELLDEVRDQIHKGNPNHADIDKRKRGILVRMYIAKNKNVKCKDTFEIDNFYEVKSDSPPRIIVKKPGGTLGDCCP